jgi:hypothetical protein
MVSAGAPGFYGFPQSLQETTGIVARALPSRLLPIRLSPIILLPDVVFSSY